MSYQWLLEDKEPTRKLYLAVPIDTLIWFQEKMLPQKAIQKLPLSLFFYNEVTEKIEKWID